MTPPLIVAGSSNTDLIVRAERLPAPGETVLGGEFITAAGGKGANQAVAAARLGARVTFVARVGADAYGRDSLANFEHEGIDTRYIVTDPQAPSGVALIVVDSAGQNLIAVASGANARLTPADVEAARPAFAEARVLLLQLETPMETVLAAAQLGREHGLTVILNPAPAQPLPTELYPLVDVLTPNEHEAETLTGERNPAAAARALLARGVKTVIVTLGAEGVLAATGNSVERHAGFRVEAVDTTAAGDCFNGGLAVALARSAPLPTAIRFAQAAAALSVTKFGAQPSLPTAAAVNAFLLNR
jgi:ribokinase